MLQSRLHTGLLWAPGLGLRLWQLMQRSLPGFDMRATGANARAAAFACVPVTRFFRYLLQYHFPMQVELVSDEPKGAQQHGYRRIACASGIIADFHPCFGIAPAIQPSSWRPDSGRRCRANQQQRAYKNLNKSGILLHVAGLWTLSTLDASAKWLVLAGMPVLMVTLVRYLMHVALMTAVVLPSQGRAIFKTRSLSRQIVRGLLMVLSTVLFFSVLKRLPLAEATSLNFMAPLFLMAMAPWLLDEPHRLHRWLGVLMGFAGVLIVVRPGSQLDVVGVGLGLLTAITFAFFQIATRRVAQDHPLTTNFYGGVFGSVLLLLALPWFWQMPDLSAGQWLLLISTGFTGFAGHLMQIMAYRKTQATLLAPFNYLQIVAAVTLGWLAFGQLPDLTSALGIVLICLGGLGVVLWETRRMRRAMVLPE